MDVTSKEGDYEIEELKIMFGDSQEEEKSFPGHSPRIEHVYPGPGNYTVNAEFIVYGMTGTYECPPATINVTPRQQGPS